MTAGFCPKGITTQEENEASKSLSTRLEQTTASAQKSTDICLHFLDVHVHLSKCLWSNALLNKAPSLLQIQSRFFSCSVSWIPSVFSGRGIYTIKKVQQIYMKTLQTNHSNSVSITKQHREPAAVLAKGATKKINDCAWKTPSSTSVMSKAISGRDSNVPQNREDLVPSKPSCHTPNEAKIKEKWWLSDH